MITECLWKEGRWGWAELLDGGAISVDGADSEIGCEEARDSWPWDDCLLGPTLCPRLHCGHLYEKLLGTWALSYTSRSHSHIPDAVIFRI